MLMIDDNMYRLAKMQESLLKVAGNDKEKHLESYIQTVINIDISAYNELVSLMQESDKYNQTLEDELAHLDKIKVAYDQLLEMQSRFINICEQNGKSDLKLSDLSHLNIEYVENRISAINGYLMNGKNIEKNKKRLELLNEQLVDEEKKRNFLNRKIIILERKLRDDFVRASVRQVVFGKLEKYDIVLEYEKIGYDFNDLINNSEILDSKIKVVNGQLSEIAEKYEIAKVCHSNLFDVDSKHILEEIEKEYYAVKYKYVMLQILQLIIQETDNYDKASTKRDNLIGLLNERNLCFDKLGIKNPLNLYMIIDMDGQMKEINTLSESVKTIHSIRNEISEISFKTETMINQNNDYLISLSDTKEMIKSNVGFNDVDITTFDDIVEEEVKVQEMVLNNQVVGVKNIPSGFKYNIAIQKAKGVIERVCKINTSDNEAYKKKEEYIPELVIGPKKEVYYGEKLESSFEDVLDIDDSNPLSIEKDVEILEPVEIFDPLEVKNNSSSLVDDIKIEDFVLEIKEEPVQEKNNVEDTVEIPKVNIFEDNIPFENPVLFSDKAEDDMLIQKTKMLKVDSPIEIPSVILPVDESVKHVIQTETNSSVPVVETLVAPKVQEEMLMPDLNSIMAEDENSMPDAFWVTDTISKDSDEKKASLSFDEQINALLAETNNENDVKKR